jgi:hypothetical protein
VPASEELARIRSDNDELRRRLAALEESVAREAAQG